MEACLGGELFDVIMHRQVVLPAAMQITSSKCDHALHVTVLKTILCRLYHEGKITSSVLYLVFAGATSLRRMQLW